MVDLDARSASPAATAAVKPASKRNDILPIAGGAFAVLALGGAAVAMTRRRNREEEWADDTLDQEETVAAAAPEMREEPFFEQEEPLIVAPSEFTWGPQRQGQEPVRGNDNSTHVERAYRGPTPDNPSVSLRTRLKRAAFMDKREREVAAGTSASVDPTAGLPDRVVAEQDRRELA